MRQRLCSRCTLHRRSRPGSNAHAKQTPDKELAGLKFSSGLTHVRYMSNMSSDMTSLITTREANVLEQLAERGKYGLELVNESGGVLTRNSVYVLLTRMKAKNFITPREMPTPRGESGPPRAVYQLTSLGKKVLMAQRAAERALG